MPWLVVLLLAIAAVAVAVAVRRLGQVIYRQRLEAEVRRLVRLERELGAAAAEVKRLRARVWRYLIGFPDPHRWGCYRWKGGSRVEAAGREPPAH